MKASAGMDMKSHEDDSVLLRRAKRSSSCRRRVITITIVVVAVIAVILLWCSLGEKEISTPYSWDDFEAAFERGDDDRVWKMYDELRLFRAEYAGRAEAEHAQNTDSSVTGNTAAEEVKREDADRTVVAESDVVNIANVSDAANSQTFSEVSNARFTHTDSESTKLSELQSIIDRADKLIERVEKEIASRGVMLLEKAAKGARWTPEETFRISRYTSIATAAFFESIDNTVASYLEGNIDDDTFSRYAENINEVLPFQQEYGAFFSDQETLIAAREAVEKVLQSGREKNRDAQLALLDAMLKNDNFSGSKPLLSYIRRETERVESLFYKELMPEIRVLMHHERTYDAEKEITRLIRRFPEDEELLSYQAICKKANPEKVIFWQDPVEHFSIKPIIGDPSRAFDGDVFQDAAVRDLITTLELDRTLNALYKEGYILVDERSVVDENGRPTDVPVPEGKRPLVLILEDFYMSGPRTESGIAHRLELDDEGHVIGVVLDRDGTEHRDRGFSAIGVIESFIESHPDFSFNGARGTIALVGQYGLFGYPIAPVQDLAWQFNASAQGVEEIKPVTSDYEVNALIIKSLLETLRQKNWNIASGTYKRLPIPFSSDQDVLNDFKMWERWIKPYTGDVWAFYYPFGEHAEQYPNKTALLKSQGLVLQCGYGPTPYRHGGDGYLYVSRVLLSGHNLQHAQTSGLERLLGGYHILDLSVRP